MMRGSVRNNVKTTLDNRGPKRVDALSAQLKAQKACDDRKAVLMARVAQIAKRNGGGRRE